MNRKSIINYIKNCWISSGVDKGASKKFNSKKNKSKYNIKSKITYYFNISFLLLTNNDIIEESRNQFNQIALCRFDYVPTNEHDFILKIINNIVRLNGERRYLYHIYSVHEKSLEISTASNSTFYVWRSLIYLEETDIEFKNNISWTDYYMNEISNILKISNPYPLDLSFYDHHQYFCEVINFILHNL